MKRKLVDPIHFFDERGRPVLSYDQLEKELARKDEEIEKLRRALKALILREGLVASKPAPRH